MRDPASPVWFGLALRAGRRPRAVLAASRGGGAQLVRLPGHVSPDSAEHERQEHAHEVRAVVLLAGQRGLIRTVYLRRHPTVRDVYFRGRGGGLLKASFSFNEAAVSSKERAGGVDNQGAIFGYG